MAKITDKTLHEATSNGDGTYSGIKLVQWMYECSTGKPMSEEDARGLVVEAQARAVAKKAAAAAGGF